jgi:hypothetical protein
VIEPLLDPLLEELSDELAGGALVDDLVTGVEVGVETGATVLELELELELELAFFSNAMIGATLEDEDEDEEDDGVGVGVGVAEVDGVVATSPPTITYLPFLSPSSTSAYGTSIPSNSKTVTTGAIDVVVTTARPSTGEPRLW